MRNKGVARRAGWARVFYPVWIFPAILLLFLVVMTVLRISGSSVGVYSIVDGYAKDSNAVYAAPRGVRSDEWLVTTQMTVAQAKNGFKRINPNIGNGQDMSVSEDVPYKEWSVIFKPQNLSFFVMPLENAFAFKWWFFLVLLIMASYLFGLELLPGRIVLAALVSLLVGLSPMVFWWYQSATILPLAYGFLIMWLVIRLIKTGSFKARVGYSGALAYILVCFGLILYPPFQIPCLIASAVFLLGWILENYQGKLKQVARLWPYALSVMVSVLAVAAVFYLSRTPAIHAIENTVYPGKRVVKAGGPTPLLSLSSFLAPNWEYDNKAASGYLGNQSEASNFIFIAPFLVIPSVYLIYRQRKKTGTWLWGLLLINALIVILLFRMYVYVAWLEPAYHLLLLQLVPNTRLLLGLGFCGILQLVLLIKALNQAKLSRCEAVVLAAVAGVTSFVAMLIVGLHVIHYFPVFIKSPAKVMVFAAWVTLGTVLLFQKRTSLALAVLIAFSLLSVYKVDPLYRGLSPLTESPITKTIESYKDDGSWVVLDDRLVINFPLIAGKHSLNSVDFYPQMGLWRQLDPAGKYQDVYNRYAHVVFSDDASMQQPFKLQYADEIFVKFNPCQNFIQKNDQYVLSPVKLNTGCVSLDKTINFPAKQFYIYKVKSL